MASGIPPVSDIAPQNSDADTILQPESVINLSQLTDEQITVLEKGLSFCPNSNRARHGTHF